MMLILQNAGTAVILSLLIVILSNSSFIQRDQTVKGQGISIRTTEGGDVNVIYAGSLMSIMETKLGPAFSHLGYDYRGEGHGSIQDANMIIDGQRFPDVFISVGEKPVTKLIDNNPSLAKWYIGFASDELVIAYNPKSQFAADFEKVKTGAVPWYEVLAKPGMRFLRSDPFLDPRGCYTVISTKLAGILYHNYSLSSSILKGERNQDQLRPGEILLKFSVELSGSRAKLAFNPNRLTAFMFSGRYAGDMDTFRTTPLITQ